MYHAAVATSASHIAGEDRLPPSKRKRHAWSAGRALLAILALVVSVWTLRDLWAPQQLTSATLANGYFEPTATAELAIVAERELTRHIQPDIEILPDGSLSVPPGRVLADIGEADVDYVVRTIGAERPPLLLIGRASASADGATWIEALHTSQVSPRGPGLLPFETRPWAEDAARLEELRRACPESDAIQVRRRGRELRLSIGSCEIIHVEQTGEIPALAFLSATEWLRISSTPEAWRDTRQLEPSSAAVIVVVNALLIALLASWLGPGPTLLLSLIGGVLSPWRWGIGVLWWLLTSVIALAAGLVRGARALGLRRSMLAALGLSAVIVAASLGLRDRPPPATASPSACLVTGYSTVHGEGLRRDADRLSERLATLDGPCAGSTSGQGFPAANLWQIADFACSETSDVLVFYGGGNDDILWTRRPHKVSLLPTALALMVSAEPREVRWYDALTRAIAYSEADLDTQRELIRKIATCEGRDPASFYFIHDLLVTDLDGIDEGRARLRASRAAAVREAGATFVDAYAELDGEASVTWFNDFIHLSRIGHARIAQLVAQRVANRAP